MVFSLEALLLELEPEGLEPGVVPESAPVAAARSTFIKNLLLTDYTETPVGNLTGLALGTGTLRKSKKLKEIRKDYCDEFNER